jgi:RNA polymerase sigma factor (sigma-70 family)
MDKPLNQMTDNQLMQLFVDDDDQAAFARIYHKYKEPLLRFSFGYTFNQAKAEENVHETFLKIHKYKNHFNSNRSFKGWIWAICKNTNLDSIGKQKREPDEVFVDELEITWSDDSVLEQLIMQTNRKHLHQALELLSFSQREATLLWMNEDLSYEEMGAILHKTPQAVKNLVNRAKNSLKTLLAKNEVA